MRLGLVVGRGVEFEKEPSARVVWRFARVGGCLRGVR